MLLLRLLVLGAAAALGTIMVTAIRALPAGASELPARLQAALPASGVSHPVTAVLLNFRGYDTLLEVAVLLLAVLGVQGGRQRNRGAATGPIAPQPALQALARLLVPPMIMVAGYLLWAGAHAPGGAFQAAAVLGGAAVLLRMAGSIGNWNAPQSALRAALVAGLLVFLAVAAAGLSSGSLLRYPSGLAALLILLVEASLTVSLGLMLAGLFLWQPDAPGGGRQ